MGLSGPDVFISYSREDRSHAQRFAERLAEEGFSVWWDAALHSGETFDEVIEKTLKAAKAVVVLWSPRSVASRWVRAEATLADRNNKLVPVIIEACDRPLIFELTHTSDLSHWAGRTTDAVWRTLIKDLNRLVERGGGTGAQPAAPTAAPAAAQREPARGAPAARRPEQQNRSSAPPRKLDNLMFARRSWPGVKPPPNDESPDEDDGDRTQFYTRSAGYLDNDRLHCLELVIGDRLEKRFIVSQVGLKIGRSPPADVILADSRVSRSHCMVELADNELQVLDLNSTNGTFVDGERVDGSKVLPVGSVLKVGNISFKHEVRTRADV
ncbi:MAG TPA: TIR domain-containing protein [Sphingomicrobium sp.]|nr:TIR domain-containing protein [Sphingomicrobium sp.]